MWPFRKRDAPKKYTDSETLTEGPGKVPFGLFHRPKEIVGPVRVTSSDICSAPKDRPCSSRRRNRPRVNLFPQISLTDVNDKVRKRGNGAWNVQIVIICLLGLRQRGNLHVLVGLEGGIGLLRSG